MNHAMAAFAGGCFWCIESAFVAFEGVLEVKSGYMGTSTKKPTYLDIVSGKGDFAEAVQLVYDPNRITYELLLEQFWRQIDPTDPDGQFADRGPQYRTAIYYYTDDQKRLAQASKEALARSGKFDKPIATQIKPVELFYDAEEYHQDFARKNPLRYKFYASASGRKGFIEKNWK